MLKYFENQKLVLAKSIDSINEDQFLRLVDEAEVVLRNGGRIIASGLGKNVPVCEKFVGSMVSLGMDAAFMHTNSAVHGDLGIVRKCDLVIILTKSGTTLESEYLAELLQKRDADIWLLTFNHHSELAKRIGKCIFLDLDHEGDLWNILPNNSTTMNLILLQGLAMTLADRLGIKLEDFAPNHPGGAIGAALRNDK